MNRRVVNYLVVLALLPTTFAIASDSSDYAMQWQLELDGNQGAAAYRVELNEEVYRQLQTPDLHDFAVLDADGMRLPASLVAAQSTPTQSTKAVPVPWFALPPAPSADSGQDWQLISEIDANGRLRRVEVQGAKRLPTSVAGTTLLVDLSGIDPAVAALELAWTPGVVVDAGYRVEASNDLEHWRSLRTQGRLLDLRQNGYRLLQRRIKLPQPTLARYLRLTPLNLQQAPDISGIKVLPASVVVDATPQWLTLSPIAATDSASSPFQYQLRGRFPITQVDVTMTGNHAVEWRLESRDDPNADWRLRAGPWLAYQVGAADERSRSRPRVLGRAVRDRYWRLRASSGVANTPPTLRLGYRPESVVFIAQGVAPYRLVAGSARARRIDSTVPNLLAALRKQRGADWQPAPARLGASSTLAGEAALQPVRDWKTWLLWGVLALGALLVAGFALSVLRTSGKPAA